MQRAVITDLNGAKMETSSGHTLTCQPHFPRVDRMSATVPSLTTPIPLSFPVTPYLFPHLHPVSLPSLPLSEACQVRFGRQRYPPPPPLQPQHTHTHTLSIVSSAESRFAL